MNKKHIFCGFFAFLLLASNVIAQNSNFTAYYTKLNQGQSWEAESRTGKYADLVVRIDATSELVFWRGNSYLPYWKTANGQWNVPEVVTRTGDGTGSMPDRVNTYSHVRLISVNADSAVVHWRYLPTFGAGNPKTGEDHRTIVDEIFTIHKNGQVHRAIKQGDASYDNWEDPLNVTVQTFDLEASGISNVSTSTASTSPTSGPVAGNPVIGSNVVIPAAWWKFDGAQGNIITESISGYTQTVGGHKINWKKGISGTALALDGYNNFITLPNSSAPSISNAVTVEAWIAPGAYPWFDQGIIHKGNNGQLDGFGLYLDEFGEIFGLVDEGNGLVTTVYGGNALPLRQWSHVALSIDATNGTAKMYINGQEVADEPIGNTIQIGNGDIHIGSGKEDANWFYTQDALMDEVRIYNSALTSNQILQSYNSFNPGTTITANPDLHTRVLPEGTTTGQFGVRHERLAFYDTWDQLFRDGEYADIVVEYDNSPVKTIFWRGASYSPFHTNDAKGRFNSEFNENFTGEGTPNYVCCFEPMSDKQHLYSHARVVENTPARVVIHWRYPQLFPDHTINHFNNNTGWGDWSDWYMYCYPDGITAYEMIWWNDDNGNFVEWAEPMMLLGPTERPTDIIPMTNTVTSYTQTSAINWDWSTDPQVLDVLHNTGPKPEIQTINLTGSNYRPVMIYDTPNLEFWGPYNDFNRYNHWPVGQKPTAGSDDYAAASRTGHTAMLKPIPNIQGYQSGSITNGFWKKQLRLEGMSNRDATSLRHLYRSWQQAPNLTNLNGGTGSYSLEQRAFQLVATDTIISFKAEASNSKPLDNPCFIVKNWCGSLAQVLVNGSPTSGVKQGLFTDTDGTTSLAVYIKMTANAPTDFQLACDATVNVKEPILEETNISLYPNPANNTFTIISEEPILSYSIMGMSGKQLKQVNTVTDNVVNIEFLPAGMYIITVETDQGVAPLKFMKM
jgi:hypothetical protein